ncbi:MAG: DNA polymerase III subunit delta [Clostridia bacterium]
MNHNDFFASIKTGSLSDCYLFEGTEEYIKQQGLVQLCAKVLPQGLEEMNLTDLTDPDAGTLIAAAETLPFMGEKRVVIVRECTLLIAGRKAEDENKAAAFTEYIARIPPSTCLVFYVKGKADGRKKLYTLLKKKKAIVDFSPMSDSECISWAQKNMRRTGKQMDAMVASKLTFTVGRDAALLKQEMDKLASYLGERETVTPEDIDAVCTRSAECTVFQMVDAQVAGKNNEAFGLLRDMLRSGEDRIGILAMLLRQYRILYHMRCLMEERSPAESQAALLGIPPFAVSRTQQQARQFNKAQLRKAYDYLLQLEYELKSGRVSQEGSAESAMLQLDGILQSDHA